MVFYKSNCLLPCDPRKACLRWRDKTAINRNKHVIDIQDTFEKKGKEKNEKCRASSHVTHRLFAKRLVQTLIHWGKCVAIDEVNKNSAPHQNP